MGILVRPAAAQDWPAMRRLFLASRRHTFPWLTVEELKLTDLDEQTVGEMIWVAQDAGGEVVGFISLLEEDHFIHHLYIATAYHQRGVGKSLLQSLPRWNTQPYQLKCLKCNDYALAFYVACGFSRVGEGENEGRAWWLLACGPDIRR